MALCATALLGSLAVTASAHGQVKGIVAGGTWYTGYSPMMQFINPPLELIAWNLPFNWAHGFINSGNYTNPDIMCHEIATPGAIAAKVAAGDVVELQWGNWPNLHHGPVLTYLAKCPGSCSDVDKTQLEFFKIDESGLNKPIPNQPGTWASTDLINNNVSWTVTIPKDIAAGNYVLRHEIIALHAAANMYGAQNYPQCVNLEITGGGTANPSGVLGTELYKPTDPGILINIWHPNVDYTIPGPPLYTGAISMSQTQVPIRNIAPTSTATSKTFGTDSRGLAEASQYSATATDLATGATPTAYSTTTATMSSASSGVQGSSQIAAQSSEHKTTTSTFFSTSTIHATVTFTFDPLSSTTTMPTQALSSTRPVSSEEAASPTSPSSSIDTCSEKPTPAHDVTSQVDAVAAPTPTATHHAKVKTAAKPYQWGNRPEKPLPTGYTLKDVMEWTAYVMKGAWRDEKKKDKERLHQRDFVA